MACTDKRIEDDDDDYVVPTSTRDVDDNDHVQSSSSLRTAEGLTVSVVKGSVTSQKVHLSGPGVGHLN